MGTPRPAKKALLFVGALYRDQSAYDEALPLLLEQFGPVAMITPPLPWNFTDHYRDEMGEPLLRRFLFFERLIATDEIVWIKLAANEIEQTLAADGKRRINLDPGYQDEAKIVLASTKDFVHRIHLAQGIYGEVTLMHVNGKLTAHAFTFHDFRDTRYQEFFHAGRVLFGVLRERG